MSGLLLAALLGFRAAPQDLDKILTKADQLLEESKKAYEDARAHSAPEAFVEAGFKLEEARIKYLVLQEIGAEAMQKTASERLRSVQQLSKLINDGRVAVAKPRTPAPESPSPAAPAVPAPETPAPPPPPALRPEADALKRLPVPDGAAVQQTEKTVRELFKEQLAKKSPADQKALARTLLDQAVAMSDDSVGLYVLYRAALQASLQGSDLPTALYAGDELARLFDVDGPALRMSTLTSAAATAKFPPEFAELADAWLKLTYEQVAADQYDLADKAVAAASQHARKTGAPVLIQRSATRAKEVAEARLRFKALKGHLANLAETPDHPEANLEVGQFLCYVKDEWELGLRFLAKGKDAVLKSLAEKEIALPTQAQDLASLADQWAELADKEKSPLRKGQMAAHARDLYERALSAATGLLRAMLVKKLDALAPAAGAAPSNSKGKPWTAIFDGRSLDCVSEICRPGWKVAGGTLSKVPASDLSLQSRAEFEDGEFRIRFEQRDLTRLKFSVRQGPQGADVVWIDPAQLQTLQGKPQELIFEVRGSEVKALLNGKPAPLTERSAATKGHLHVWAQGESLRLLSLEFRPLK